MNLPKPTEKDQKILQIQLAFQKAGYQWKEHIFNDGEKENCVIDLTKITDPYYLDLWGNKKEISAWGRLERLDAWKQAYAKLLNK